MAMFGFPPPRAVDADLELRGECTLGDLAVEGRPRQAGAGKNGFATDDPIWLTHGSDASCWLPLTASGTSQSKDLSLAKTDLADVIQRRGDGRK